MHHFLAIIALFLFCSNIALSDTETLEARVEKILKRTPLIDGHNDLPMRADEVPPGAPTVVSAGPLLPAEHKKIIPCLFTTSSANLTNRPLSGWIFASP